MSSALTLGIIVSLVDRASGPARQLAANLDAIGVKAGALAAGMAAGMAPMIRAYADLDEGATRLRATLMDSSGKVPETFKGLSAEALRLGTLLPGTTNDFYRMFDTMVSGGTAAQDVIAGMGEATAYLAVVTKQSYEATAQLTTGLRETAGVAAKDMMPFLDVIQRVSKLGSSTDDMAMSFARSAGGIKAAGLQGLEAGKSLGILYAALNKITKSPEVTGTAFGSILMGTMDREAIADVNQDLRKFNITLDFMDQKTGKFKGLENLLAQFEKLRTLNPEQQLKALQGLLGKDAGAMAVGQGLVSIGASGLAAQTAELAKQANLQQRVKEILGDTKNIWGSLMGTIETVSALLAGPLVEWAKPLLNDLNAVIGKVGAWVQANERLVLIGGQIAAGLVAAGAAIAGIALTAKTLGFLFGGKGGKGGAADGVLDAAAGVVKVFVTNWPGGGIDSPDGGSKGGAKAGAKGFGKFGALGLLGLGSAALAALAVGGAAGYATNRATQGTKFMDGIDAGVRYVLARLGNTTAQLEEHTAQVRRAAAVTPAANAQRWAPIGKVNLGPAVTPLTPDPAAAQAQTGAAQTQTQAAQTQADAAQQHTAAAQTQQQAADAAQAAAGTLQSAANQLQHIGGTITVRVTGPAQVTGATGTGGVDIVAESYSGKTMTGGF